jgi:hypothetical protein
LRCHLIPLYLEKPVKSDLMTLYCANAYKSACP